MLAEHCERGNLLGLERAYARSRRIPFDVRRGARSGGRRRGPSDPYPLLLDKVHTWLNPAVATITAGVSAWVDQKNGHTFLQASTGAQPARNDSVAENYGLPALEMRSGDYLTSDEPASTWSFLHYGPCEVFQVFVPRSSASGPHTLLSTGDLGTANNGCDLQWYESTDFQIMYVSKTGSPRLIQSQPNPAIASGTRLVWNHRHGSAASPQYAQEQDGVVTNSGSYNGTPNAGAPAGTLRIGARASSPLYYGAHDAGEIIICNAVLTADERAAMYAYLNRAA